MPLTIRCLAPVLPRAIWHLALWLYQPHAALSRTVLMLAFFSLVCHSLVVQLSVSQIFRFRLAAHLALRLLVLGVGALTALSVPAVLVLHFALSLSPTFSSLVRSSALLTVAMPCLCLRCLASSSLCCPLRCGLLLPVWQPIAHSFRHRSSQTCRLLLSRLSLLLHTLLRGSQPCSLSYVCFVSMRLLLPLPCGCQLGLCVVASSLWMTTSDLVAHVAQSGGASLSFLASSSFPVSAQVATQLGGAVVFNVGPTPQFVCLCSVSPNLPLRVSVTWLSHYLTPLCGVIYLSVLVASVAL